MEKDTKEKNNIFALAKSPYIQGFFKKYGVRYLVGIIILVSIDYLQTKVPIFIGNVIDDLQVFGTGGNIEKAMPVIWKTIVMIISVALVIWVGRILWRFFIFGTARSVERDIRNDIFGHLEKLSMKYFSKHKTGEIMAYITNDLEAVRMAMGPGVLLAFDVITLLIFTLYNMITKINFGLTLAAVVPLACIAIFSYKIGPNLFARFDSRQEAFAEMSDFVQENISGIRVVKAFVQQKNEMAAFKKINQNYYDKNIHLSKLRIAMDPVFRGIAGLAMAVAIGYGGYITIQGTISTGNFVSFVQYLGMLVWPMMALGMVINTVSMGSASLKRIEKVLGEEVEITDSEDSREVDDFRGTIDVQGLSFAYPDANQYALKDISFKVGQGQTLGIVGRTGSGKTTLVDLLLRLYNVERGKIFISGTDIMDIPLKTLRSQIGYVPQDNFLFSDTIKNNIDFTDGGLALEEIRDAAEFACVDDNITEFVQGYETIVGERGVTLSGGQKQRTAIARAIIKEPEILIMDDSLSAVDTDTEEQILQNFEKRRRGKTNIIIAHRLSAVQDADLIIVLDEGKIIESGTHKELITENGFYSMLYQKQLLEKNLEEEE